MSELDKTNQKIATQGQFDFIPSNIPQYEYSQLISFSASANGVYPLQSPFGVDSEVNYNVFSCSDSFARVYMAPDISLLDNLGAIQPGGIVGFFITGAVTLCPADAWVPVKDILNIQISNMSTGSVQLILQWRMRSDMVLPSQEQFKRFSEPTF